MKLSSKRKEWLADFLAQVATQADGEGNPQGDEHEEVKEVEAKVALYLRQLIRPLRLDESYLSFDVLDPDRISPTHPTLSPPCLRS
jgi:hypothetical protein